MYVCMGVVLMKVQRIEPSKADTVIEFWVWILQIENTIGKKFGASKFVDMLVEKRNNHTSYFQYASK